MKEIMNKINRRFESDARTIRGIIVRSAVTAPASCRGIKALLKRSSVCSCSAGLWRPFGFQRCAFVSCVFMRDQLQMCKQASEMSDDVAVLRSRRHAALTPNHDMQWRFHFFSHLLLLWIHVPSVSLPARLSLRWNSTLPSWHVLSVILCFLQPLVFSYFDHKSFLWDLICCWIIIIIIIIISIIIIIIIFTFLKVQIILNYRQLIDLPNIRNIATWTKNIEYWISKFGEPWLKYSTCTYIRYL